MNKQELRDELDKIQNSISAIETQKRNEKVILEKEKYEPLVDAAKAMKDSIYFDLQRKYNGNLLPLLQKKKELEASIQQENIKLAKTLWHPQGTIVCYWNHKGEKTDEKGIVQIYDASQEMASNLGRYSKPREGDITVFFLKKDGSIGKKFVIIATVHGGLNWQAKQWIPEGQIPTINHK